MQARVRPPVVAPPKGPLRARLVSVKRKRPRPVGRLLLGPGRDAQLLHYARVLPPLKGPVGRVSALVAVAKGKGVPKYPLPAPRP